MLNPTVLGFKRGTVGLAFIFVTLVNNQKGFRTQNFNTSITGFITTKFIFDPPFYYQVKKCVNHSLSIKSDPYYSNP